MIQAQRVVLSGLTIALGLGLAIAAAPSANAMPAPVPPSPQAPCGASAFHINYDSCVVTVNGTRGFSAPDTPSAGAGLAFSTSNSVTGLRAGRSSGWALGSAAFPTTRDRLEAGNGWSAYDCQVAGLFNLHGCSVHTTVSYLPEGDVVAGNRNLQRAVVADNSATIVVSGDVRRRATPVSDCAGQANKYVRCQNAGGQGPNDFHRFNFHLANETVSIGITNRLVARINNTAASWTNAIEDLRGRSQNANSIQPSTLGNLPVAWRGGLLAVDRNTSAVDLNYVVADGQGNDADYNGSRITIHLSFGNDQINLANACQITPARFNAPRAVCDVQGSSPIGSTRLLVTIHR